MSAIPIDTQAVVKELKAAGFSDVQAETVTRLVGDSQAVDLSALATKADLAVFATKTDLAAPAAATKADIGALAATMKADLSDAKAEILKWMVGSIGIQTVVIIGAVIALVRVGH